MIRSFTFVILFLLINGALYSQDNYHQLEKWLKSNESTQITNLLDSLSTPVLTEEKERLENNLYIAIILQHLDLPERSAKLLQEGYQSMGETLPSLKMKYAHYLGKNFKIGDEVGLSYFRTALDIAKSIHDTYYTSYTNHLIGGYFLMSNEKYETSQRDLLDSAFLYYNKALLVAERNGYRDVMPKIYGNLASVNLRYSELYEVDDDSFYNYYIDKFYAFSDSSLQISISLNDSTTVSKQYLNQFINAFYYEIDSADTFLEKAAKYMGKNDHDELATYYMNKAQLYSKMGNYEEAYENLFQSNIHNLQYNETKIETDADLAARSNAILVRYENQTNLANKSQEQAHKRSTILTALLLGLITFFSLLFFAFYRNFKLKRKNLELAVRTTKLEKEKQIRAHENKMRDKIISTAFDAKEAERKEVSEFLHNSISSMLSSANLHLHTLKKYDLGSVPELIKAKSLIEKSGEEVRRLSHQLVSPILLKFGLEYAITDQCELLSSKNMIFTVDSNLGSERFPEKVESKIFLVTIEFCQNVIKHSKATKAEVILRKDESFISTTVIDNGIGIEKSKNSQRSEGLGLGQIKSLALALNGEFSIKSLNKSTIVLFKIPHKEVE